MSPKKQNSEVGNLGMVALIKLGSSSLSFGRNIRFPKEKFEEGFGIWSAVCTCRHGYVGPDGILGLSCSKVIKVTHGNNGRLKHYPTLSASPSISSRAWDHRVKLACLLTTQILVGFYDPTLLRPLIVTCFIAAN